MYPRDATTTIGTYFSPGTYNLLPYSSSYRTILYASINDNTGAEQAIYASSTPLLDYFGGSVRSVQESMQYVFNNKSITAKKTNTATTTFKIVWIPRDRSVTPDPYQQYSTSTPVTLASSTLNGLGVNCIAGCNGTSTFPSSFAINNFPTGFNVNNFPALQPVAVNNFPSLQDVRCTIGCDASTTLILSSSTIEVLTTTAPTFQEWMLVVGVFLAINSIHMWNFLFGKPKVIK